MELIEIKIDQINMGSRIRQDLGDIDGMASSLSRVGQLQPIIINRDHLLVAGGRRLTAAKQLGWDTIAAVYRDTLNEAELREIELEENLKRKDLNWVEEVIGLERVFNLRQARYGESKGGRPSIGDKDGYSQADAAEEFGRVQSNISLDLTLARGIREFPELCDEKSKASAFKRYRLWQETRIRKEQAARNQEKEANLGNAESESEDVRASEDNHMDAKSEQRYAKQSIRKVIWKGKGSLYHADALDFLPRFVDAGGQVDCIVTDPPFGLGMFKEGQAISGGRLASNIGTMYDDDPHETMDLLDKVFMWAGRALKPDGHAYIFFHMTRYEEMYRMARQHFGTCEETPLIWIKNTPGIGDPNRTWVYAYEPILWVNRGRSLIKPQAFNYLRYESVPATQRHHPMQKPAALLRHLISASCVPGEQVLDLFAGSGSTLVAAHQVGVRFIGVEKMEEFHRATTDHLAKELFEEPETPDQMVSKRLQVELEAGFDTTTEMLKEKIAERIKTERKEKEYGRTESLESQEGNSEGVEKRQEDLSEV